MLQQPAGAFSSASFTLFDRFRPSCPASSDCIHRFDPKIETKDGNQDVWVAVFRSSNNKPSVLVQDEFLHAMKSATGQMNDNSSQQPQGSTTSNLLETNVIAGGETPVAIARLRPSEDIDNTYIMDPF